MNMNSTLNYIYQYPEALSTSIRSKHFQRFKIDIESQIEHGDEEAI